MYLPGGTTYVNPPVYTTGSSQLGFSLCPWVKGRS